MVTNAVRQTFGRERQAGEVEGWHGRVLQHEQDLEEGGVGELPLGLQLIGRPWEEGELLNLAHSLERAAGFAAKPAKWW